MRADLHIHTNASDGLLSPAEIVEHACQVGLTYIAVTDHDTVNGLVLLNNLNHIALNITIIPGIELSADLPEHEVHILGYNIDILNDRLNSQLNILVANRRTRVRRMIARLSEIGYAIEYEDVMQLSAGSTSVGRPAVAKALVAQGYFSSVEAVFQQLLYNNGPAYVPHYKLSPLEAISLIREAKGIPVLAHPGLICDDSIVKDLIRVGISGLEVFHPRHNSLQTTNYLAMANENGLLVTGGSDFHAIPSRFPEELGVFTIPSSLAKRVHDLGQA